MSGVLEAREASTVRDGWGFAPAENQRADRQVQFIHEAGAEEGVIQFTASLAQQALDFPLVAQPCQRVVEIEFLLSTDFHGIRNGAKGPQPRRASLLGGEDYDWGEALRKNVRPRVEGTGTRDDDAEVSLGQTALKPEPTVLLAAGSETDPVQVHCPRSAHDSVGGCAKSIELFLVAPAAEGGDETVGCGDFPVGRSRHVDEYEWKQR